MDNVPATVECRVMDLQETAMTVDRVVGQVQLIQQVMERVMKQGEHYGTIPGCGDKPSLKKPGAEKLSLTFRLAPYYEGERAPVDLGNGHREYVIKCTLKHIITDQVFGQGVGSCSTMEAKYRYRNSERKCPKCGKETIVKGKTEYGGGWICFAKKGGCGAKFKDKDQTIEGQSPGRVEHDNPADYYNTVLKMAKKRAHVDAVLTATAASDIFTQDVEDMVENGKMPENGHLEPEPPGQLQADTQQAGGASPASQNQIKAIFAISKKREYSDENRAHLCEMVSKGRTKSTKELTKAEASAAIEFLNKQDDSPGITETREGG